MNVGKSLKIALAMNEKTQVDLVNELKMTRQQVSRLANNPSANSKTIERLAKSFGLSASEFIALGE